MSNFNRFLSNIFFRKSHVKYPYKKFFNVDRIDITIYNPNSVNHLQPYRSHIFESCIYYNMSSSVSILRKNFQNNDIKQLFEKMENFVINTSSNRR